MDLCVSDQTRRPRVEQMKNPQAPIPMARVRCGRSRRLRATTATVAVLSTKQCSTGMSRSRSQRSKLGSRDGNSSVGTARRESFGTICTTTGTCDTHITVHFVRRLRRVDRSLTGEDAVFENEPRWPSLGNLSTHTARVHPEALKGPVAPEEAAPKDTGVTAASRKLMEAYLKEGALNPALEPTQIGFQRLFAAWLFEDDLPFTTGESPGLARLFKYLKINVLLPSDTTVRNTLGRIFIDLHGTVVRELTVRPAISVISYPRLMDSDTYRPSSRRLHTPLTRGLCAR